MVSQDGPHTKGLARFVITFLIYRKASSQCRLWSSRSLILDSSPSRPWGAEHSFRGFFRSSRSTFLYDLGGGGGAPPRRV
jgi:hypothetical protein